MREIKFRAWDKKDSKMYIVHRLDFNDVAPHLYTAMLSKYIPVGTEMVYEERESENFELMQFTGLKDKLGKEIYEGDILEWSWKTGGQLGNKKGISRATVKYEPPYFLFDNALYRQEEIDEWKIKIKGNIYENPELLEGGEK